MAKSEQTAEKKVGRPAKSPDLGKRVNVMFRLNEVRRDQLMAKAEANGRSMSEEIERRLEGSLQADTRLLGLINLVGGADMLMFCSFISGDLNTAIKEANNKFGSDPEWFKSDEKLAFVCAHMGQRVEHTVQAFAGMSFTGAAQKVAGHILEQE